jgi:hypothetical protein
MPALTFGSIRFKLVSVVVTVVVREKQGQNRAGGNVESGIELWRGTCSLIDK